jgi:S1-C subfamily serine protease
MTRLTAFVSLLAATAALVVSLLVVGGQIGPVRTQTVTQTVAATSPTSAATPTGSVALSVKDIYSKEAQGVVLVTSTSVTAANPILGLPAQPQEALGSGFVIDKAGHIITNYHVVQGAKKVSVSFSDTDSVPARVIGTDPSTDIAVLEVKAPAKLLDPLPLGDSSQVAVGDPVVAIGNPLGLDRTATAGIISALQRQIQAPNGFAIDRVIQTDAAINHGNSGGPLIDAQGQVIGVNSQIATDNSSSTAGNIGIGFSIPINTVKTVADQLIAQGHVSHPFLGVRLTDVTPALASAAHLPLKHGLLVQTVDKGTGAAKAGLKGGQTTVRVAGQPVQTGGDLIVAIDGKATPSTISLRDYLATKQPGDQVDLTIYRGAKQLHVQVTLGAQPQTATG